MGEQSGDALGNWSTGTVTQTGGTGGGGGLIGYSAAGRIGASWSGVHVTTDAADARAGGLGGRLGGEAIVAVYSTGVISTSGDNAYAGGLMGEMKALSGGFTAAYVTGPALKTGGEGGGIAPLYGIASTGLSSNAVMGLYWNTETTGFANRSGIQQRGYDDVADPDRDRLRRNHLRRLGRHRRRRRQRRRRPLGLRNDHRLPQAKLGRHGRCGPNHHDNAKNS